MTFETAAMLFVHGRSAGFSSCQPTLLSTQDTESLRVELTTLLMTSPTQPQFSKAAIEAPRGRLLAMEPGQLGRNSVGARARS
uniref:Uncharacterized protein n=1 Tax=Macrostomum lignano TaxID=282301 RepID=A0A1I8FFV2_9PLAT